MARISDIYYTTQNLDGIPEPPGKSVPIDFYQGDSIILDVFLNYEGEPVNISKWNIKGTVKKNQYAQKVLWVATLNDGCYKLEKAGFFRFLIPASDTAKFLAGTYWLAVSIAEKLGSDQKDLEFILVNQPFSINYSVGSPNTGDKLDRSTTERTYPPSIDISK